MLLEDVDVSDVKDVFVLFKKGKFIFKVIK